MKKLCEKKILMMIIKFVYTFNENFFLSFSNSLLLIFHCFNQIFFFLNFFFFLGYKSFLTFFFLHFLICFNSSSINCKNYWRKKTIIISGKNFNNYMWIKWIKATSNYYMVDWWYNSITKCSRTNISWW